MSEFCDQGSINGFGATTSHTHCRPHAGMPQGTAVSPMLYALEMACMRTGPSVVYLVYNTGIRYGDVFAMKV